MSWIHDKHLSSAMFGFTPGGSFGLENRLVAVGRYYKGNTGNQIIGTFYPMHPSASMCLATGCTFENSPIFDLFFQYTANASAVTLSDFFFWGRLNAWSQNDHSPPQIFCFQASSAGFTNILGLYHLVSKEGWNIGGVSFPSVRAWGITY